MVYDATWNQSAERTRRVAAKTMKNIESQQQLENFLKEGVMMKGKRASNALYSDLYSVGFSNRIPW